MVIVLILFWLAIVGVCFCFWNTYMNLEEFCATPTQVITVMKCGVGAMTDSIGFDTTSIPGGAAQTYKMLFTKHKPENNKLATTHPIQESAKCMTLLGSDWITPPHMNPLDPNHNNSEWSMSIQNTTTLPSHIKVEEAGLWVLQVSGSIIAGAPIPANSTIVVSLFFKVFDMNTLVSADDAVGTVVQQTTHYDLTNGATVPFNITFTHALLDGDKVAVFVRFRGQTKMKIGNSAFVVHREQTDTGPPHCVLML